MYMYMFYDLRYFSQEQTKTIHFTIFSLEEFLFWILKSFCDQVFIYVIITDTYIKYYFSF